MAARFSIIVPVYNVAEFLRECLDSVAAQTVADWECICVDDGSTDGGGAVLDEYAARDARFRAVHKPNGGVSSARNAALDAARGEWIAFLDADDVWHPRLLEECAAAIDGAETPDVVAFEHMFVAGDGPPEWPEQSGPARTEYADLTAAIPLAAMGFNFWSRIYRRETVEGLRFKPYSMGEDLLYMAEAFLNVRRMATIGRTLYGYRRREGSAMNSGLSAAKLADSMRSRADLIAVCGRAGGRMARDVWKSNCNALAEASAFAVSSFPRRGRAALADEWRRLVRATAAVPGLPAAQRLRMAAVAAFPFLARPLCALPHALKLRLYARA